MKLGVTNKQRGFTLLEIVIVLGILGIISFIIFASTGGDQDRTRASAASQIILGLADKTKQMKRTYGCWPNSIRSMNDIAAYVNVDGSGNSCGVTNSSNLKETWVGPHVQDTNIDDNGFYIIPGLRGRVQINGIDPAAGPVSAAKIVLHISSEVTADGSFDEQSFQTLRKVLCKQDTALPTTLPTDITSLADDICWNDTTAGNRGLIYLVQ